MTDLRGEPADLSSEPIVPLQLDAASGPEQVISEKALETGSRSLGANAWRDLRRRPMFWISLALIVIFLVDTSIHKIADTVDVENPLCDDGAAHQRAEVDADVGNHRDQGVA